MSTVYLPGHYGEDEKKQNELAAHIIRKVMNMDLNQLLKLDMKIPVITKKMTQDEYIKKLEKYDGVWADDDSMIDDIKPHRYFNRKDVSFDV